MLEFLQTGRMLYVLAAICALGTLSTLVTGSLYKRLIKETGNMALTKDEKFKGSETAHGKMCSLLTTGSEM